MAPGLVAAAAIVVVAGLVVPGLLHKSPAGTGAKNVALPAQHGPGPLSGQSPATANFGRAGGTAAKTKEHAVSGLRVSRACALPGNGRLSLSLSWSRRPFTA